MQAPRRSPDGPPRPATLARPSPLAALLLLLALPLLPGCGGESEPPTSEAPIPDDEALEPLPPDAAGQRSHATRSRIFGPWWGSGCPDNGACGCGSARDLAQEANCQLDRLQANDIPITVYLFDGSAWSPRNSAFTNSCTGADCCAWKLGDALIQRLARDRVRGLLHFWGGCHDTEQYNRAWSRLGQNLLGFYLDDGSSDAELQRVSEFMQSVRPGAWENVAKAYQGREPSTSNAGLSQWANAAYVGDLSYDFDGLRTGVDRVLAKSRYLPAPYNELTGYAYQDPGRPDEEVYHRRLHFGAMQPVMAHTPYANADPWRPEYSSDLVPTYRYWAWLHKELVPYFYSYAIRMHEDPALPVLRRGPMTYSLRVGNEIYAPIVIEPTQTMTIRLPGGNWIDYWDETRLASGTLENQPVPLGREPIFLRQGSIIPMDVQRGHTGHGTSESAGSLTVLVYPSGTSSFRYREEATGAWITFTSRLSAGTLTLTMDPGPPAVPVLFRIGRWGTAPRSMGVDAAGRLTVNQGGSVPEASSEREVNGSSRSAWFYDAPARRLIVKFVAGG
jgi:hypothetical protein